MHQLIGLGYIPIIPIIFESVRKPVIFEFFVSPKVVGAAFLRAFSAQAIFTLLRQQMEDGGGRE